MVCVTPPVMLRATAPLPRFRLLDPPKVKVVPVTIALAPAFVISPPLVLSIVPPLIVSVPLPNALALLMFRVPVVTFTPPAPVLLPESVSAPAETVVNPL